MLHTMQCTHNTYSMYMQCTHDSMQQPTHIQCTDNTHAMHTQMHMHSYEYKKKYSEQDLVNGGCKSSPALVLLKMGKRISGECEFYKKL